MENLVLEDVEIGFRNFEGREGLYNREGERSFVVFLDHDLAEELAAEGWNVKYPKERADIKDEEDTRSPYLPVDATIKKFPPKFVLVNGENAERLEEDQLAMLDWVDIRNVKCTIRPYEWERRGESGVKAYLVNNYIIMETDPFIEQYGV